MDINFSYTAECCKNCPNNNPYSVTVCNCTLPYMTTTNTSYMFANESSSWKRSEDMDKKLELSAPWVIYYREVEELFKEDPEVRVVFDEEGPEVKLYVKSQEKADALTQLLPAEKKFGNVTLKVTVIPANQLGANKAVLVEKALKNNPAVSFITKAKYDLFSNPITYVVFQNKVVQYYADNLGDIYGNCSTLYQDIAKDVLGSQDGVYYCTDKAE